MYGVGEQLGKTQALSKRLGVDDVISFKGNVPNSEIIKAMRQHEIFLLTSDKKEGWGAVLNEAMSNGCSVVASDAVGSVPFLIKDGYNGLIFKSNNIDSLYNKVSWLIDNPKQRIDFTVEAYKTMHEIWSPSQAANNLIQLIDDLKNGRDTSILEGPCSKAEYLRYR